MLNDNDVFFSINSKILSGPNSISLIIYGYILTASLMNCISCSLILILSCLINKFNIAFLTFDMSTSYNE